MRWAPCSLCPALLAPLLVSLAGLWPRWSVFLPGSCPALAEGLLGPADYVSSHPLWRENSVGLKPFEKFWCT